MICPKNIDLEQTRTVQYKYLTCQLVTLNIEKKPFYLWIISPGLVFFKWLYWWAQGF